MRSRVFLYLFIFSLLFILYQYTTAKNYFRTVETDLNVKNKKIERLNDSIQQLSIDALDLQYFDLENNDDALVYFEEFDIEDMTLYISDKLLETNETKGDNPLVPYAGVAGNSVKINKIKILNHRWIIADFTDGKYWGELFLTYEVNEDKSVAFTLKEHLLYTRSSY